MAGNISSAGTLAGKAAGTNKVASDGSHDDGDHGDSNKDGVRLLGDAATVAGAVLGLGHKLLVGSALEHLLLGALVLGLSRGVGGDMLGGSAGYQLDVRGVDVARRVLALDDLDAVDLFVLVFLLNQTHGFESP